jgi:signal transduction histidine kinase
MFLKKCKNIISILLTLVLVICDMGFAQSIEKQVFLEELNLTSEEKEWLLQNKNIIVASDPTMAPLEFITQNGEITGIAGEYLDLISSKLNVNFIWAGNNNWSEGLMKIHAKEAQVLSGVNNTEARREFLFFTDSYFNTSHMIFAREGGEKFGNMDGLSGFKISLVVDFAVNASIRNDYPNIEIVEAATVAEALLLVADGKVDAYVGSISAAAYYIAQEGLLELIVVGDSPYRDENAIGIRKDLPLLASAMQKAMITITPQEKTEISRKWLALNYEATESYDLLLKLGGIGSVVLGLILFWNYSLRREVYMRKTAQKEMKISREKARLAQAEAEEANAAKSRFLANMSHELRTPLNAIIGFSETMSLGLYGEIKQVKYLEYLRHIKDSGKHLESVINDILDLSKIEAGKWQIKPVRFSLSNCLKDAMRMIEIQASAKNIDLKYENLTNKVNLMIVGDENAYKRIVINLLSNAVKFTNQGGKIICKAFYDDDKRLILEVVDNGIGIPEDKIDQVLLPFGQVHETREMNKSGTGLGLAIVKELVEIHGGTFTLKSKVNVGTRAIISINSILDTMVNRRSSKETDLSEYDSWQKNGSIK